ncbi:hypothetical protein ACFFG1_18995, partial [Sinomonas atrocyanea]|uniref:hypothetical protein n=1 Tax=Sinomonas atrocyanea TaxID=37927 RepID=UPI0035EB589A
MLRDPIAVVALEGTELPERSPIQLAPGDVRIDLRGPLAVRPVRDAQVPGIVRAGTLFSALAAVVTVELTRTTVITLRAITERTTLTTIVTLERTTLTTIVT